MLVQIRGKSYKSLKKIPEPYKTKFKDKIEFIKTFKSFEQIEVDRKLVGYPERYKP